MPFIISRGAYSAQLQNEPAEQCVGDWKSKGMGHTILEGWTVPAVGMGMFVLVVVSGILSGTVSYFTSTEQYMTGNLC